MGNTLDVDNGQWSRLDAGVGAGVDSYYEYLLKVTNLVMMWAALSAHVFLRCFLL